MLHVLQQQRAEVRAKASELYASPALSTVRLSVDKEIAAKKLLVRDDKDMYAGKTQSLLNMD